MITAYTIRHRTRGDVGGFDLMTAATLVALAIGWPLADWTIEPVEARPADVAPFFGLPTIERDK